MRAIPSVHICVEQLKAKDGEGNVPADAFSSLTDAAERVTKIMRFVGCLLNMKIEDSHVDPWAPADVLWLVGYRGKQYPEKSLQDGIQNSTRLQTLCDEVVRTASTAVKLQPEKDRVMDTLQKIFSGELDPSAERLEGIVSVLPDLRKGIRQNEMQGINSTALEVFTSQGREILEGKAGARVTTRWVGALVKGLSILHDMPGTTDLHDELMTWMSQHRCDTAFSDLVDLAKGWNDTGLADIGSVQEIMGQLQRTKIDKANLEHLWSVVVMLVTTLRTHNAEAGCGCCSVF